MNRLTEEQIKDIQEEQNSILAQLKERPYDLVLIAGLTYTAGLLKQHDIILEHCAKLFYNEPTNTAYLGNYSRIVAQNISDGHFDLLIEHKKKFKEMEGFFEDYLEKLEIACGKQTNESGVSSCKEQLKETIFLYEGLVDILNNPNLCPTNNTPPEPL